MQASTDEGTVSRELAAYLVRGANSTILKTDLVAAANSSSTIGEEVERSTTMMHQDLEAAAEVSACPMAMSEKRGRDIEKNGYNISMGHGENFDAYRQLMSMSNSRGVCKIQAIGVWVNIMKSLEMNFQLIFDRIFCCRCSLEFITSRWLRDIVLRCHWLVSWLCPSWLSSCPQAQARDPAASVPTIPVASCQSDR